MRQLCRTPLFMLLAMMLLATPAAQALETAWQGGAESRARLLAARDPGQSGQWILGIEVRLAAGWKTYWRWPGEAGAPPRFDFAASDNLTVGPPAWPLPVTFESFGARQLGYGDEVLFTLPARPVQPDQTARARLQFDYMICETICIPESARFDLPLAGKEDPALARRLNEARAAAPGVTEQDLVVRTATVHVQEAVRTLRITARSQAGFRAPRLIAVAAETVLFAPATVHQSDDGRDLQIDIPLTDAVRPAPGSPLHLLLTDGSRHVMTQMDWPQ